MRIHKEETTVDVVKIQTDTKARFGAFTYANGVTEVHCLSTPTAQSLKITSSEVHFMQLRSTQSKERAQSGTKRDTKQASSGVVLVLLAVYPQRSGGKTTLQAWECRLPVSGESEEEEEEEVFPQLNVDMTLSQQVRNKPSSSATTAAAAANSNEEPSSSSGTCSVCLPVPHRLGTQLKATVNFFFLAPVGEPHVWMWSCRRLTPTNIPASSSSSSSSFTLMVQLVSRLIPAGAGLCHHLAATPHHLMVCSGPLIHVWALQPLLAGAIPVQLGDAPNTEVTEVDTPEEKRSLTPPSTSPHTLRLATPSTPTHSTTSHYLQVVDVQTFTPGKCLVLDSNGRLHILTLPDTTPRSSHPAVIPHSVLPHVHPTTTPIPCHVPVQMFTWLHRTDTQGPGSTTGKLAPRRLVLSDGEHAVYVCTPWDGDVMRLSHTERKSAHRTGADELGEGVETQARPWADARRVERSEARSFMSLGESSRPSSCQGELQSDMGLSHGMTGMTPSSVLQSIPTAKLGKASLRTMNGVADAETSPEIPQLQVEQTICSNHQVQALGMAGPGVLVTAAQGMLTLFWLDS